jgi:hypothetical protein
VVTLRLHGCAGRQLPGGARRGVRARTVVTMLVVFASALDDGAAQVLLPRNIARLVKRLKVVATEMATWTPEQAAQFRTL